MKDIPPPRRRPGWLDHPVLSLLIGAAWLLLQQSVLVPQLIVAAILALLLPRLLHGFLGHGMRLRRPLVALRFFFVVLWDIVVANVVVAWIVVSPTSRPSPAWVPVPLDIRDPVAISLLATIITTTPGTVSCVVDDVDHVIHVHALDCSDVPALAAQIKSRYERPLAEILG